MYLRTFAILAVTAAWLSSQEPAKPAPKGFDAKQWNAAVGLGGGAGGKYSARGGRLGGRRKATEAMAIGEGLGWLKRTQLEDGSWAALGHQDVQVAATSLALLAMLGDGSTMRAGPYKGSIKSGVKWLRDRQSEDGAFAESTGPHMLATYAMTEAFHFSSYRLIKKNAARGLQHLESLRHPDGGWRVSVAAEHSDPALTLWGATLLVTAVDARLLPAEGAYAGVIDWMSGPRGKVLPDCGVLSVAAPAVRVPELAVDQVMANAFTRYWVRSNDRLPAEGTVQAVALDRARKVVREWASTDGRRPNIHEWFCSSNALFQAGDTEAVGKICAALAAKQIAEGEHKGSWEPIGFWGEVGGRVWTTAMAVLVLETPYRYTKDLGR